MVGRKKILAMMIIISMAIVFFGCSPQESSSEGNNDLTDGEIFKIGISQLAEHAALDDARIGFIDGLEDEGFIEGENIIVDYQNAQGEIPTTQLIAQNLVSQKVDLIFAITTPAAQSAFNVTKDIPILFTAVTDPVEAGIAESWESSNTNATGTSDATPIEEQFALLLELVPEAKKVGIIYNTSEVNSEIQIKGIQDIAEKFKLEIVVSGVTNANEIPQALDALVGKIDVLYTPTDNLIASSMPLIVNKTSEKNIPVVGAESAHVENGALATDGISYYDLGFQTAKMAVEVLRGKKPAEIPISTMEEYELLINEDSAKKLNITIPESLKNRGKFIKGGANS
ncbi:MAG TPA: ABC transporter substrate-binding protein [Eubacteriaceae bacterium]|nr:ABC transporter substrate-binding protein [Eubacteriaceae bacterium]